MADNVSRRGAVDLGMPLMILAFLVIGGFLYWLNGQAAAERALDMAEDTTTTVEDDLAGVSTIAAADIQLDASPFEGQLIRLAGLQVTSPLGTQGFWLELPNRNPFLVSMTEELKAEGLTIENGSTATVTGTVMAINDSILTAWTESGAIGEGDRLAAEFAVHFLEAQRVQFAAPSGGSGGPGS